MPPPQTLLNDRYLTRAGAPATEALDLRTRARVALHAVDLPAGPEGEAARTLELLLCLRHPQLPVFRDLIITDGQATLVADPVGGPTLAERVGRGERFSPDQVAAWADQLLDALDYLHALDPPLAFSRIDLDQLVLQEDGRLVLDGVPRPGVPQDDLDSLAAALYTLLSGAAPPTPQQRQEALGRRRPDPLLPAQQRNPAVPASLGDALQRALSLRVVDRPQSATEFQRLLAGELPPPEPEPEPPRPEEPEPLRRPWLWATAVMLIVLLTTIVLLLLWPRPSVAVTPTAQPAPSSAPTLAPTAGSIPSVAPTATAESPTPTTLPSPTLPPITPAPSVTPPPPVTAPTVVAIDPAELFIGALPARLTLRGAGLDLARSAQLLADGRSPVPLQIEAQAADTLILTIGALPDPVVGAVPFQLVLDGVPAQLVTLRDFLASLQVQGVNAEYLYTGRVGSEDDTTFVTRMRLGPQLDAERGGFLQNGDLVEIVQEQPNGWVELRVVESPIADHVGKRGWIERWLVDNQNVPPQRFVGTVIAAPSNPAPPCDSRAESVIAGRVVDVFGRGVADAELQIRSADGRRLYVTRTNSTGAYRRAGLGCTAWEVRLTSVPNQHRSFVADAVLVQGLSGAPTDLAEVVFRLTLEGRE